MILRDEFYLAPRFSGDKSKLEELLAIQEAPDATSTQWIADCPRRAEHAIKQGLRVKGDAAVLQAGRAIHAAAHMFHTGGNEEDCLRELTVAWGDVKEQLPGAKFAHLNIGHLEVIFKNYMQYSRKHQTFRPIILKRSELKLDKVLAAILKVNEKDEIVLGESKIVMEFMVNGESFVYSGIPDLPVEMGGAYYVLDHKSTNAYLSKWYFDQYKFSNQLRGYCVMVQELSGLPISGALINGIYIGERATLPEFKGEKFMPYGPLTYQPGQLNEAILNQYYFRKLLDVYEGWGYYPQHSSKLCSGCPFFDLCDVSPAVRESVIVRDYVPTTRTFLNI